MKNRTPEPRCHRCRAYMSVLAVGEEYCQPCKRDIAAALEAVPALRVRRFPFAKDLTDRKPAA